MVTPTMYDRTKILELIQRDFGDPGSDDMGSSCVVVGGQKVGKTFLLNHFWLEGSNRKDTLSCRVNVSDLQSAGFCDDSFMRLFLGELQNAVGLNIKVLEPEERVWKSDLEKLAETAGSSAGQKEAIRAGLLELDTLRRVHAQLQIFLQKTEPIEASQVFQIFNGLRKIRRRVVLVIDEFHIMMRKAGFTNQLFAFLRGATTQGKILTLVSSPVHLMDPYLHENADAAYDRVNLFNHYQVQFLQPFNEAEADGYLDWLPPLKSELPDKEKAYAYIRQLGGGSPYFLKKARDLFDQYRPSEEDRGNFESKVARPAFQDDFRLLWERLDRSPEEQTVLKEIATTGKSASILVNKLEREGYLSQVEGGGRLFSILFTDFVRRQQVSRKPKEAPIEQVAVAVKEPVAPPKEQAVTATVSIGKLELVSETLISALGLAKTEALEIFRFEIENAGKTEIEVRVACTIQDCSQATVRQFPVKPGKTTLAGLAVLREEDVYKLESARPRNVDCRVSYGPVGAEKVLADTQIEIKVLPPNNFLMAVLDSKTKKLQNYTWLIAAWVRKRGPELQKLLREAGREYQLDGYQPAEGEDMAEHTRKQVCALYNAVSKREWQYQNSAEVYLKSPEHYLQEVRFPEQSIADESANCFDMAVLFSTLLVSCQIAPLILLVPGHALVGWKDGAGGMEFLQTVGIAKNTFEKARDIGMARYLECKKKCGPCLDTWLDTIEDTEDFAILVDVVEQCRQKKLAKV